MTGEIQFLILFLNSTDERTASQDCFTKLSSQCLLPCFAFHPTIDQVGSCVYLKAECLIDLGFYHLLTRLAIKRILLSTVSVANLMV